jgi:hypothetical protein
LTATDAVDPEAAQVLERLDGSSRPIAKNPVGVDGTMAAENGNQPALDI